jgi:predicted transposase YbfD/YdcC
MMGSAFGSLMGSGATVFDVGALWARLGQLTDRRRRRGKRYQLGGVLLLMILAKLSSQDQPSAIADWVAGRREDLLRVLGLTWKRMPQHNTYRRVLGAAVQPDEFDRVVGEFLKGQPGAGRSVLVAIDGKTLRGTIDESTPRGEHLLAAYLPAEGIVLMQLQTGEKENEITVAPQLLKCIGTDLRCKVVAGDAMQTQRELSVQILEAGGDYLWIAKDNQPKLRADIERLFAAPTPTVLGGYVADDFQRARTVEKGHGRLEIRELTVSSLLNDYLDWPGVQQVFRLERQRVELKNGKQTTEVIYGLTSLKRTPHSAHRLLGLIRTYWGIENGLHNRRDVTFNEDRTRLTQGDAGHVMATINNLVIGILRQAGATNLAEARRNHDAHFTQTVTLLAASLDRL